MCEAARMHGKFIKSSFPNEDGAGRVGFAESDARKQKQVKIIVSNQGDY